MFFFYSTILKHCILLPQSEKKMSQETTQETTQEPLRSRADISLEVTFAILVFLTSVLGYVLVLYVVNRYSKMQTITNIFIQNLLLTDIFLATLNMPFWIMSLYMGK